MCGSQKSLLRSQRSPNCEWPLLHIGAVLAPIEYGKGPIVCFSRTTLHVIDASLFTMAIQPPSGDLPGFFRLELFTRAVPVELPDVTSLS